MARRPGFTLIEGLVVIAVIGIIAGISMPMYRSYQERSNLQLAMEQLSEGVNRAKLLSQLGEGDSGWGFSIEDGILYRGEDFASRDPVFDESYPLGDGVSVAGVTDISFTKIDGTPNVTGTAILQLGDSVLTFTIDEDGTAAPDEGESFQICHYPPGNPENAHTLTVSENAWPAHQKHGDTVGPCDDDD